MLTQFLLLGLLALTPLASAQAYGNSGSSSSSSSSSSTASASAAASTTSSSSSSIHSITVGAGGALAFSPDTITAAVGDTLVFSFQPGDHSVAQSTFGAPCTPSTGGIYSGFFASTSNAFVVTVNNTDPMWLYCAQIGHCNAGMAMVVNPPTGANTIAAYKKAAASAKAVTPPAVQGGIIEAASKVSAGSGSSSLAASTSAPAATTSAAKTGAATKVSYGLGVELLGLVGVGAMWVL